MRSMGGAPQVQPQRASAGRVRRVGYVLSRFPKLTETFILSEIVELQRQGVDIRVHALVRDRSDAAMHPAAADLLPSVVFPSPTAVLAAQLGWLRRKPGTYASLWWTAFRGNIRSPRFLVRALATVPLGAYFASKMAEADVDHVHAHWATHSALAGLVAGRLLGIGFSFTAHAHDIYVDRTMLREKIMAADFVVTISDFNQRYLRSLYPAEAEGKIMVVHCGIDPQELAPPARAVAPDRPLRVLCVASLQPQKGHADLLRATALLSSRGSRPELAIVGDGPESSALHDLANELGLNETVTFLGALARPRVLDQLRGADVMALASVPMHNGKMEGIPVALMEAMAMEVPVVATTISGIPELVDDGITGFLVPPKDPDALADALSRLEADRDMLRGMGSAARRKVSRDFNLHTTVGALREMFARPGRLSSAQGGSDHSAEPDGESHRDQQDQHRQDRNSQAGD